MKKVFLILMLISSTYMVGQTYTFKNVMFKKTMNNTGPDTCSVKIVFSKNEVIEINENARPVSYYRVRVDKIEKKPFIPGKICTWYYCTNTEMQKNGLSGTSIYILVEDPVKYLIGVIEYHAESDINGVGDVTFF